MCNLSEGVWDKGVEHGIGIGKKKGKEEGIELGARQNSIETVKNLLKMTMMTDQQISDAVSGQLTSEEVAELRKGIHLS